MIQNYQNVPLIYQIFFIFQFFLTILFLHNVKKALKMLLEK